MDTQNENREMLSPYVSVDCVLLGINDDKLTVLLAERKSEEGELIGYKIPGSLIYENEDLDDAAYRILNDSTGLKRVQLKQFRCFGSPARTSNRLDVMWLEATSKVKIGRLITVAYLALCKNSRKTCPADKSTVIHHLVRAPKLERRELHRHIVENDSGLLLHPITDLLYGSLDNLFMIEWQARKLVDRAPTDRVGFIGRGRLPVVLVLPPVPRTGWT